MTYFREVLPLDHNELLNLGCDMGRLLMESGGEIFRVEDSIQRLMHAYGMPDAQVFAIPNCLIVSLTSPEGRPLTSLCRIRAHGNDIEQLELCNDLCRRLCRDTPPVSEARQQVAQVAARHRQFPQWLVLLAYGMGVAAFAPFFGGGVWDALSGFLCGLAIGASTFALARVPGVNGFFRTMLVSLVAALSAQLLFRAGLARDVDAVTISGLMPLVPGVALTTAMREVMASDVMSGLSHLAESLLTATSIALGTGAALAIGQFL